MVKTKRKRKPYSERNDLERIRANWRKIERLYHKEEWSSVVTRSATATEIAINLVIREELTNKRKLEKDFVESLLRWANGIQGKANRLILPLLTNPEDTRAFRDLFSMINDINKERNSVVHSGQFKRQTTAIKIVNSSKEVIEALVGRYERNFVLKDIL